MNERKFKPERPIVLNENNTGKKSKAEVELLIEQLRQREWLCKYGDQARPLLTSFNDEKMFAAFKKDAKDLGANLNTKIIAQEDPFEELKNEDEANLKVPGAEDVDTYQDPDGNLHKA